MAVKVKLELGNCHNLTTPNELMTVILSGIVLHCH